MTNDDMLAAERLDRFWDGLVAGRATAGEVDVQALERSRLVRRVQAGQPAGLSRADRTRIWRVAIARSSEEGNSMTDMPALLPPLTTPALSPPARRVRAWRPALEFAAAAALILVISGGYFAGNRLLPGDTGNDRGNFAALSSPEATDAMPALAASGANIPLPDSQSEADGPIVVSFWRLTVDPGATWRSPADAVSYVRGVKSAVGLRPVGVDEWMPLGARDSAGFDRPVELRNQGSERAVVDVFLLGFGNDVMTPSFPGGISARELAGSYAAPLDGGEAYLSVETLALDGSAAAEATLERDTGRDGAALIVVERGEVRLNVIAGNAVTRPRGDDGELLPANGSIPPGASVSMLAGDSAVIHVGAAFGLESSDQSIVTMITVEQNTARAQGSQSPGKPPGSDDAFPSPGECVVAPRSIESLERLVATPIAATPDAFRVQPGDGDEADDPTIQAVTATMRELAACYNARDALRIYALFSDSALQTVLTSEDVERASRGQSPSASSDYPMPTVWDVRIQPDGRVTAKVDFFHEKALVVFVRQDDRWLIDFWNDGVSIEDPPLATPAP